ncbi:hypothetical protein [Nonomuraea sp. NPDC003709]|uniref:hypothetical protein n=1 Tax=Nonomuraea sp. NPDC003709 TaxID=3154450 RepID=UPI0033BD6A2E
MDAVRELDLGQTAAAIEVDDPHMAYGHKEVLRGVGFTVAPGEVIGLGMRSALLPDSAAAAEIGSSWRPRPAVTRRCSG